MMVAAEIPARQPTQAGRNLANSHNSSPQVRHRHLNQTITDDVNLAVLEATEVVSGVTAKAPVRRHYAPKGPK